GPDGALYYLSITTGTVFRVAAVTTPGLGHIIAVGAGPGAGPNVKVFDARTGTEVRSFFAYDQGFTGGVRVATGDVNGDGVVDIITGAGPGGPPQVRAFDGRTLAERASFLAYGIGYSGGIFVAAGDTDGDGRAEVITGTGLGTSHVK